MKPDIKITVRTGVADIDFLLCNKRITIMHSSPDSGRMINIFGGTFCTLNEKQTPIRIGKGAMIKGSVNKSNNTSSDFNMKELYMALKQEIEFLRINQEPRYWYCTDHDFLISLIEICSVSTFE